MTVIFFLIIILAAIEPSSIIMGFWSILRGQLLLLADSRNLNLAGCGIRGLFKGYMIIGDPNIVP